MTDRSWAPARVWPEAGQTWPWQYAVWDSAVLARLLPPLEPIQIIASGNVRDYKTWEGYPNLDAERLVLPEGLIPKDSDDDARFLRLPTSHPLHAAGPGGSPIGPYQED